ncbi:MAG: hypothetical protein F4Y04_05600 [Chloroflexi bacterium]|nr:hypothetical protein [Chloroflexota bacterium]
MHGASLESSFRLQRVLEALLDGGERSTLEIALGAQVCAVNSCVAELRTNGFKVDCRQARSSSGERVWLYRLDLADPGTAEKAAVHRQMTVALEGSE